MNNIKILFLINIKELIKIHFIIMKMIIYLKKCKIKKQIKKIKIFIKLKLILCNYILIFKKIINKIILINLI